MCCGKKDCITPISSECVFYEGKPLKSIPYKEECDKNFTEVIEQIDGVVDSLKSNFKDLDKKCLSFDKNTVTQKDLNQLFIYEICDLKSKNTSNVSNTVSVGDTVLNVNCTLNNCNSNSTKLTDLIQGLCNEINTLKQQVNTLQSQNLNNILYTPNV